MSYKTQNKPHILVNSDVNRNAFYEPFLISFSNHIVLRSCLKI